MAILVTCGACGAKLRVRDEYLGKDVWCPACKAPLTLTGERVPNHEVFVSYSNKDKAVAGAICATLEEKKIRCWIAPRDISAGNSWGGSIIDAIEDAQVMVLVYSGHSNLSPQVIREVERAVAKGLTLVPFRIEATPMSKEMEYFLSSSHWFDALTPPVEKHLAHLTETIKTLLLNRERKKRDGEPATPVASPARKTPWLALSLALTSLLLIIGMTLWIQHYRRNTATQTVPATNAVINLMPLIDLTNDVVAGTWTWNAGKLASGLEKNARVQLPYEPPPEYDFRIVFSRIHGNEAISQIFSQNGRAATWTMAADVNRDFRWNLVGGQTVTEKRVNQCLENGRIHTSILRVRKNGVKAYLDDNLVGNWITDFSDASLAVGHEIPNHRQIGIMTWSSHTIFHQIEVVEITGKGRITRDRRGGGTAIPLGEAKVLDLGDNVKMELVWIPPGEFMMGSTPEEQAWASSIGCPQGVIDREGAQPRKAIIQQGFWLGRTEVTVGQWKRFVNSTGYRTDAEKRGSVRKSNKHSRAFYTIHDLNWNNPGTKINSSYPVTCISWNDAVAFCNWMNQKLSGVSGATADMEVRLPTEAEWEYACRGGRQGTRFWWGDSLPDATGRLNWAGSNDGFDLVTPVDYFGARGRNGYGLADMLGNVDEWCLDDYDPLGAHDKLYKGESKQRTARGGSYAYEIDYCRCSGMRSGLEPNVAFLGFGFRICYGRVEYR